MRSFLPLIFFICLNCGLHAADITATLDSADGSSGFVFKDSTNAEIAEINSNGRLSLDNNIIMGGTLITSSAEDSVLAVSGGVTSGSAADIELYGGSHATNPGHLFMDAARHYFRDADASPTMLFINCSDKKIGVGTALPSATMEVLGTLKVTSGSITAVNSSGNSTVSANSASNGSVAQFYLSNTGAGGTNWGINAGNSGTGTLGSSLGIAEGSDYRMVIKQGGMVGIGCTDPSEALEVNGNIEMRAVYLCRDVEDSGITVSAGLKATTQGANLEMYGGTNALWAGEMYLDAAQHVFRDTDASGVIMTARAGEGVRIGSGSGAVSATLEVRGTVNMFGAWVARAENTNYQAQSDGFVLADIRVTAANIWAYIDGYTDSTATPSVRRASASVTSWSGTDYPTYSTSFTMPVRKGDYYRVTYTFGGGTNHAARTIYWIPLGKGT
ncbi:MAG: hypothetical protein PHQ23_03565 [Candidatus Wallbacteria bacterium]|nr:hypothetical protein [Candidatus Wallbacteria bacterium]